MRLKIPLNTATEILISLINQGYQLLEEIKQDYGLKKSSGQYNDETGTSGYWDRINIWATDVVGELLRVFPTELEKNQFLNPESRLSTVSGDYKYGSLLIRFAEFIRGLEKIRQRSLPEYTDLPLQDRLYVEDIDSFHKVRDVNPSMAMAHLTKGFLKLSEDKVQTALEQILNVPFHKKDWGGEINDLYTTNVVVSGKRRAAAFLLKGPGIGNKEMTIADCGTNGDQIVRLFSTPANLFVVQHVGPISDLLVKDVEGKTVQYRLEGKMVNFLIIDGQDTARILLGYGKLETPKQ